MARDPRDMLKRTLGPHSENQTLGSQLQQSPDNGTTKRLKSCGGMPMPRLYLPKGGFGTARRIRGQELIVSRCPRGRSGLDSYGNGACALGRGDEHR